MRLNQTNSNKEVEFKKALASVWKFNKKTEEVFFTSKMLIMLEIEGNIKPDVWYKTNDENISSNFTSRIENFKELIDYLRLFTGDKNYIDFGFKLKSLSGISEYYLEGYQQKDIITIVCIEDEFSYQVDIIKDEALVQSQIGSRWLERIEGKHRIFHTKSSKYIYGSDVSHQVSRELFSGQWQTIADKILKDHPDYTSYFENNITQINKLINGEKDTAQIPSPWLNSDNEIIWVEDRVSVLTRDENGIADIIVATTIDVTESKLKEFEVAKLEEKNRLLLAANKVAIDLAQFLVWRVSYEDFPKGDYIFVNEIYTNVLGLKANKDRLISYADFRKTIYPDKEGMDSEKVLNENYDALKRNEADEFQNIVVKQRNLITKEVVYLEHNDTVEERYPDGRIKFIGGYIANITKRVIMEKNNEKLIFEREKSQRAERLAIKSGRVMIWYIDSEKAGSNSEFYGNELLFSKLGLTKVKGDRFLIEEFNESIYKGDEEGLDLYEKYDAADDRVENNEINSYSKLLVKHQNIINKELFYFEHNFEVDRRYDDGSMMVRGGFMTDVTLEINYKNENDYLVGHDEATGLKNRNAFEKYTTSVDMLNSYTLIIADIDGLKFINDAFGHLRGDEAISFVGNQFKDNFTQSSSIYRIGGDEFAIISSEIDENKIMECLAKIKENIDEFNKESDIQLGVSLGFETVVNKRLVFNDAFILAENLMYRRKLSDRNSRKSKTMEAVLQTLHEKTEETKEHCDRLGVYAVKTLKKLGFTRTSDLEDIEMLCQLHDIGKITISEEILSKPGKLTVEEYSKIKGHAESGYKIVKNIVESDTIAYGVLHHHERVDGKGYPFGLKGYEIPLFAKIISIVDAYDVMISGRKYCTAITKEKAIIEIIACSGTQFDKKIADVFIETLKEE